MVLKSGRTRDSRSSHGAEKWIGCSFATYAYKVSLCKICTSSLAAGQSPTILYISFIWNVWWLTGVTNSSIENMSPRQWAHILAIILKVNMRWPVSALIFLLHCLDLVQALRTDQNFTHLHWHHPTMSSLLKSSDGRFAKEENNAIQSDSMPEMICFDTIGFRASEWLNCDSANISCKRIAVTWQRLQLFHRSIL